MSKYFSFLRKKRSPSLTDEAGEDIRPSLSPGGKLRKHKGKKGLQSHVDDGFCDQRFSLQNYDFYEGESEDCKVVSSEVNSMHSDNDSLLDNLSYGEVCSSEGDKSLQWEKVETLNDDSRPSSSSECPRVDPKSDSIALRDNNIANTSLEEDEGLAHERPEDYFSFDHKDLVEQVSLPELTEVDVGSHLIDDFMDEAFDDLEECDEDIENDRSSGTCIGDSKYLTEDVGQSVGTMEEPSVSTKEEPSASIKIEPFVSTKEEPSVSIKIEPSVGTIEGPSVNTKEEQSVATIVEPSVRAIEEPSVSTKEEPAVDTIEEPSVSTIEEPSIAIEEGSSVAIEEGPSVCIIEKPTVSTKEKPSVGTIEWPLVDTIEVPSVDIKEAPSVGTIDGPSVGIEEGPSVGSIDELSVVPLKNNIKIQIEENASDQEYNSAVNKVDKIANSESIEDLKEAVISDLEISGDVEGQMQNAEVEFGPQSIEIEGKDVITRVPIIVTHFDISDDSSPPSINDDKKSFGENNALNNDTGISNNEITLLEVQEQKLICDNVSDPQSLDDGLFAVSTCNDLVSEKNIWSETDFDKCEQEVRCAGNDDVKKNLEAIAPQEGKVDNVMLQNDLSGNETCFDISQDNLLTKVNFDESIVETEIKATLNSDFLSKENLENSPIIVNENEVNTLMDESLPIEQHKTDSITDLSINDYESACKASLDEAVSIKVQETVILTDDSEKICEILPERKVSGIGDNYISDDISHDREISGHGGKEAILSSNELESPTELGPNQCESDNFSMVISDKDIPKTAPMVEDKTKAKLGNSERTTISVSTESHSEFDDEFDSAKEDLTDDETDAVYDNYDCNITKHLTDSLKSEVFKTEKESEPTLSVLCDNKINTVETGGKESDSLLIPSRVGEEEVETQDDVTDKALCEVAISCDVSLVSLMNPDDNSCISKNVQPDFLVCSQNVCDFNRDCDGSFVEDKTKAINADEITDEAVTIIDESKSEAVDSIIQSTTALLASLDTKEIVIACDEVLIPTISSQISLNDCIAKDFDLAEKSVDSDSTMPKDDCNLLDEESALPDDTSLSASAINDKIVLQNTVNNSIGIHDVGRSDNELNSTNDTSSSSSPSKKHSSVSSDEISFFGHSDHVEAEARLAQRRAARAEARELRLRELEKQQLDQDDEDEQQYAANSFAPADKKLQNSAPLPPRTNSPYIPKSSPRGASVSRASVGRASSLANSTGSGAGGPFSRRSSEDSTPDDALPLSSRELKAELKELEEKFRKAMITNAQLDNEKATLTYEVEFLKDKYSDLEESHNQLTKEHKKKCSENETLRKLTNKLKEEVNMVRKVLQERDSLIQEYGLVLIGEENGEENGDDDHVHDEEMDDDTINDLSPRKIGVKKALLSMEASELLAKGAAQGSLDVRLKKYAERKNDLEDEVRRLKLELEDELSKRRKENGLDYEKQKEASKSINEYKFRVQKAEAEVSTLQANVARLESLVTRYKASTEELEKSEEDLKSEKRRLQRELREAQNRLEELELTTSHLQKRFDKLKTARSTLLKDLSQDPV